MRVSMGMSVSMSVSVSAKASVRARERGRETHWWCGARVRKTVVRVIERRTDAASRPMEAGK
ncbi:MAG: hypothetical protein ACM3ZO_07390 [Clostridia bacterium]